MTGPREPAAVSVTGHVDALLVDALAAPARRAARTLVSGDRMRVTLLALAAGAELSEHESPGPATLQVLRGRGRLSAQPARWLLDAGDLVEIPARRHALAAETDMVVLLTVARG